MKLKFFRLIVLGLGWMGSLAAAAPSVKYIDQMKTIAQDLDLPFDTKKPALSQALDMREALHERVAFIARMSSRHTLRCKRIRRQLLEVNYLIREIRADGSDAK